MRGGGKVGSRSLMMNRRAFMTGLGAVLAAPRGAEGQQAKIATVVLLGDEFTIGPLPTNWTGALRQGLRELGWVDGVNLRLEQRSAKTLELRPATAAEVVSLNPDVIVAAAPAAFVYGIVAPEVGRRQLRWSPIRGVPIVFAGVSDPVAVGMVQSLARPGGAMTGITYLGVELNTKRLQLLKEALPTASRIGVLVPSNHVLRDRMVSEVERAAAALGVKLQISEISGTDSAEKTAEKIDHEFATMARERVDAVLGLQGPHFFKERRRIGDLSVRYGLPGIFELGDYAEAWCLMAYAPNVPDIYRYAATFVDRILKGPKPANLPLH